MKKIISLTLTLALCLSLFSFMSVFAEETLLNSESFEDGLGSWVYWNKTSEPNITFEGDASDGKKAVKMVDNAGNSAPGIQSPTFDVVEGAKYKATFDYKLVSGKLFGISLRFLGSDGKKLLDKRQSLKAGNSWNSLVLEETAPEGAVGVIVLMAGNNADMCEIYLDNVKLYASGVKEAEAAAPAAGDELFFDSFENGLDKWGSFSKAGLENIQIVTSEANEGKSSLHCVDTLTDAAPALILAKYIPVTPGNKYIAYADYKLISGDSFRIILRFFDADKKKISEGEKNSFGKTANTWETLKLSATAPENAATCAILIAGYSKNVGEAYIDNIKLTCEAKAPVVTESKMDKLNKSSIALFVGSANALVNGEKTLIDKTNDKVIATIVDSRTLVPVRFIAENFGAEVGWDDATRTVTLTLKDKTVKIVLDKAEIDINGSVTAIDVPAQSIEGRTMLPLRAFVETVMGKTIFWDARGLIVITDEAMLEAEADKAVINQLVELVK